MPGYSFNKPIKIQGESIEDELIFLQANYIDDDLLGYVFAYFENYFLNHKDFDKIFNGAGFGDFEKIDMQLDKICGDYHHSPVSDLKSLIEIAIEATLEGANFHTEMQKSMKVFCEGEEVHWSTAFHRMMRSSGPGYIMDRYSHSELESGRRDYENQPFKLVMFETEMDKFLNSYRNGTN